MVSAQIVCYAMSQKELHCRKLRKKNENAPMKKKMHKNEREMFAKWSHWSNVLWTEYLFGNAIDQFVDM